MTELVYGPLNKSLHTQTLELLTKVMLHKPSSISLCFESTSHGSDLFARFGEHAINVSQLIKKANLHHIQFSQKDSDAFFSQNLNLSTTHRPHGSKLSGLTRAEKDVISGYAQSSYFQNNLLYNKAKAFEGRNAAKIVSTFIQVMLLSSGLNKIRPQVGEVVTYRGEQNIREVELKNRIAQVKQGQGYTQEPAFKSTSLNLKEALRWADKKCLIKFEHCPGKDISELSFYKSEEELLLHVEKIMWTGYQEINGLHIFTARIINPLDNTRDEVLDHDLVQFNALSTFAKENDYKVNHLSQHNEKLVSKHRLKQSKTSFAEQLDNLKLDNLDVVFDWPFDQVLGGAKASITNAFKLTRVKNTLEASEQTPTHTARPVCAT